MPRSASPSPLHTSPRPDKDHRTRASSVFPYSTARPPTNYSQQAWLPDPAAPIPSQLQTREVSGPFDEMTDEEPEDPRTTPLYARSEWDANDSGHHVSSAEGQEEAFAPQHAREGPETGSAWSRSSYAGQTAGLPSTALSGIREEEEVPSLPRMVYTDSPAGYGGDAFTDPRVGEDRGDASADPQSRSHLHTRKNERASQARSTLPSVLELEYLTDPHQGVDTNRPEVDPFADANPSEWGDPYPSKPHAAPPLTPNAQAALGPMSVSHPRYSLPAPPSSSRLPPGTNILPDASQRGLWERARRSQILRMYLIYRPFVVAGLALLSALLLTMSMQSGSRLGWVVVVPHDGFAASAANGVGVGLGVGGWCSTGASNPTCRGYQVGDFANSGETFQLPGDSLFTTLHSLLIALTTLTWLLSAFTLTTAFLHFYLFFALSIPFHHLVDLALDPQRGRNGYEIDDVQGEVDLRVRCERPPYEGVEWVWWAWWGHRRGMVGDVFAGAVGAVGFVAFCAGLVFKSKLVKATGATGTKLGSGAFVPLIVLLFTSDPVWMAIRRLCLSPIASWNLFTSPPSPSPAALLLPPSEKPMIARRLSGESFFAPALSQRGKTLTGPALLDREGMDDETRRWLLAYPKDPSLVHLIASLRKSQAQGQAQANAQDTSHRAQNQAEQSDFILSDLGLLYLRPDDEKDQALLVPPRGEIRDEILADAHLEPDESGHPGHAGVDGMMRGLEGTFWWEGMEGEVLSWVSRCGWCNAQGMNGTPMVLTGGKATGVRAYGRGEGGELKAGMTAVPFTGVTGWTEELRGGATGVSVPGESAMAAEMAWAMRKAREEADGDGLR